MWSALAAWGAGQGIAIAGVAASDLDAYLRSRGGSGELSARYAWRLVRLVDRVLSHYTRVHDLAPSRAAGELISSRLDIRYANSADTDPLPDFLAASEAKLLATYLSSVRPRKAAAGQPWQEVRNRASVGLMLGAGLGFDLCPRLRDLSERKLYLPAKFEVPQSIERVTVKRVSLKARTGWDELLRIVASIRLGRISGELALRYLSSAAKGDPPYEAAKDLGRLLCSVFLCDFVTTDDFRRENHTLLSRGESARLLQRAI